MASTWAWPLNPKPVRDDQTSSRSAVIETGFPPISCWMNPSESPKSMISSSWVRTSPTWMSGAVIGPKAPRLAFQWPRIRALEPQVPAISSGLFEAGSIEAEALMFAVPPTVRRTLPGWISRRIPSSAANSSSSSTVKGQSAASGTPAAPIEATESAIATPSGSAREAGSGGMGMKERAASKSTLPSSACALITGMSSSSAWARLGFPGAK